VPRIGPLGNLGRLYNAGRIPGFNPSSSSNAMARFLYDLTTTARNGGFTVPPPTRGGGPSANLGLESIDIDWGGLAKKGADVATDWLVNKLKPTTPLVPTSSCPDGQVGIPPACFDLVPGGDTSGGGMYIGYGEAVMGRYGAAIQPAVMPIQVKKCPRGAVLGNDGLCYNSRDLRKSDRMWVPGRKPLLTGGDLNAIARASRAANKMKTQQKRLQKLGLLPKPNRGRGAPRGGARAHLLAGAPGVQLISND